MADFLFKSDISEDIGTLKTINPGLHKAWMDYHDSVFADGALTRKEKELIAVAGAHITRCPYCIRGRVRSSKRLGSTDEEIVEAIYVAMRFAMGAPYAYSSIAFEAHDAIENKIPLTEGHFFKKDISHEIGHFKESTGEAISKPFMDFHNGVFADGALDKKMKRGLIGLACAHMTKCPYCIRGCVKDAMTFGVTEAQMAEAINVAMVMSAGACYAHTGIAMDTLSGINAQAEAKKTAAG
ncbi:MAG: carboxymuconolactone decarboxylase family protein [Deltaproteobacteria bacterium]